MNDYFDSPFCNVKYMKKDNVVLLTWKKFACGEDYRTPTMFASDLLKNYSESNFIIDARNGFEDDKADVKWGFDVLLPDMAKSDCKKCIFILNQVPDIEVEIDLWTAEFKKYFDVHKVLSYEEAIENIKNSDDIICETNRLILRRYRECDLEDLYEYLSDSQVVEYEPYHIMTKEEVKENLSWRIGTDEMIAVQLKESGKMIGNIYLGHRDFESLELGFVFNRFYWKKGYASESSARMIEMKFKEGTHRIYAECDTKNEASWKTLEKLGMEREAFFKQNVYFWKDENGKPIWKDTYVYSILNGASV